MESSNPMMSNFKKVETTNENSMSLRGTTNKTMFLLLITIITSLFSWKFVEQNSELLYFTIISSALVAFIIALIVIFNPKIANVLGILYAFFEGISLGAFTMYLEKENPGIGGQALVITVSIFMGMLLIYGYRIIKVTDSFRKNVIGLTFGILIVYIISILANLFGMQIPLIHESGIVGICFSLFVIAIAALNLLLDFDFIEKGVERNLPKYMEWYGAFSLLVTIIWLYIEVLKLLAKKK